MDLLFYTSAFYLAPDLVLGDFNLPKIGWSLQGDGSMHVNETTDLESDLKVIWCRLMQLPNKMVL
jgi:hypothetical protein